MPLSTDVNLPRDREAVFPDRCIRCGEPPGGGTLRFWTHWSGWIAHVATLGNARSVCVPACRDCGFQLLLQRWIRHLVMLLCLLIALFVVWPLIEPLIAPGWERWAFLLVAIVCILPWGVWVVYSPPCFDVSRDGGTLDYEFRDADYAHEFAELNGVGENDAENYD